MDRKFWFVVILLVALKFGSLFILSPEPQMPDAHYYNLLADSILEGKGPVDPNGRLAMRMPGYPYFLAIVKKVSTEDTFVYMVRFWQHLLTLGIVFLIYQMATLLFDKRVGQISVLLLLLNPMQLIFSNFLLNEALFGFFLVLGVYFFIIHLKQGEKILPLLLSGIGLGLSLYMKESVFLLPLFTIVLCFLFFRFIRLFQKNLIIFVIILGCLSPWMMRNYQVFGEVVPFTSHGGLTLYDSINLKADGSSNYAAFKKERQTETSGLSEIEADRYWMKKALSLFVQEPLHILSLMPKKFIRFWNPVPNASDFGSSLIKLGFLIYYLPFFFFFLFGLWQLRKKVTESHYFLFMPILYFTALHSIFIGSLRYRMPVEPFIVLFAAVGLVALLKRKES